MMCSFDLLTRCTDGLADGIRWWRVHVVTVVIQDEKICILGWGQVCLVRGPLVVIYTKLLRWVRLNTNTANLQFHH